MKTLNKIIFLLAIAVMATVHPVHAVVGDETPTVSQTPVTTRTQMTRAQVLERVKSTVTTLITKQYITRLETLKTRVQENEKLGQDAKTTLIQKIDTEIAWYNTQKSSVTAATAVDAVKAIAKECRAHFKVLTEEVRRLMIAGGYVTSLERVIDAMEKNMYQRIESLFVKLEGKGIDTLQAKDQFEQVKEEVTQAKDLLPQIRNSTTHEQAKDLFTQARDHLKTARTLLKEMLQGLKAQAKNKEAN